MYKTPAPSPISDKERRALLHIRQENSTIKREMAQEPIISFRLRPRKPGPVRGPIMFHLNREIWYLKKLLKENELLNLRNTNQFELPNQTPQLRTVSSDFTWAFMRRIADGQSIQMMTDGRQYKAPLDGTRLPPIIPPKLSKMKIAPIRSFVDEISKQLLSICNEVLNLMVSRLFQGGSIYSDTFIEPGFHVNLSSSHWLVILSSDWLNISVRKWNPF